MKKLKLLLAFCALLLGWSNANAQKDVTSQYITNATLSNGLNGWTVENFNGPQRGNNTVGYASECWAGNPLSKTSYSLRQTITLPAGNYQLVNYSFYRQSWGAKDDPNKSLAYLKAGDDKVAIKTLGSITAPSYANSQAEGANCFDSKMYRNVVDFTIAANNTSIEIGIFGTHDAAASWVIAGMFELINLDEPATMDAPFDVTGYITNPGFEYRDMTGWTVSPSGYFGTQSNNQGFKVGGWYAEKWQPAASGALPLGSATQTLTNLPAGYYKLTANLGGDGTYVDMNGKTASWTADKDYTVGYVLSENEDLTITFGKTAEGTANWIHFDNFRLQFCGDVQAALTSLLNSAENLINNATMSSSVKSNLQTAYNTYNKSYSDVDELLAAIAAMQEAVEAAQASVAVYNNISTAISTYANKAASLDAAGQAAYDASGVQTKYNNGTYETLADAEAELQAALVIAVKAQTTADTDWTAVIANPSFETGNFDGWTNEGMATQSNTSFEKDGTYYAEAWQPNGTKSVRQTISELPSGVYRLSAKSKARGVTSAKIFANGIDKAITISDATAAYSVEFACDANADVEIGFEGVGTGAGSSWLCVDNFTLTLVSSGLPDVEPVTGKMNAEIASAQATAIETYEANKTVANYNAASAAIAAAQASKDAYAVGKAALDKVDAILANTNVYTDEAYTTFSEAKLAAQNGYDNGTWTNEEANAYGNTVFGTGWRTNATIDDFLISAWDVAPRNWDSYHVNTWSTTGDSGNPNFFTPCIEYWTSDANSLADKLMMATISGKTPGDVYKVEAKVCVGVNSGVAASTEPTGISLQLNDGEIVNVCSGARTGETRFYEGDFEVTGQIGLDGNLYVKFNVASTNVSWITFRNVKYTFVSAAPAATAEEKQALADAIAGAEAKTLGFEAGEYAPYNNVDVVEVLNAAKAIDPATVTGFAARTATNALTSATWKANEAEVNAIPYGDFNTYFTEGGQDFPYGWTLYNTGNNSRIMGGSEGASNVGLAATSAGKALLLKFNATYGESTGYTMPLKAGKIYKISFLYGGWNNQPNTVVSLTDPNGAAITLAPNFRPATNDAYNNAEHWYTYTGYFASTTAGDYKLHFNKVEGGQQQIVISDIEIVSASELEFADGSAIPTYAPGTYPTVKITRNLTAARWATAVYPFAVSNVFIDHVAVLNNYDSASGVLEFDYTPESEPNVPFLMFSKTNRSEIILYDVAVDATANSSATKNEASLIGAYTTTEITNAEKNYVLSNNQIFSVGEAGATVDPYRAYIQLDESTPVKALSFVVDGTATGVDAPVAAEAEEDGVIYNTSGQQVTEDYKGIVIKNGKKYYQK